MNPEPLAFSSPSETALLQTRWTKLFLTAAALSLALHGLIEMASIILLANPNAAQPQFAFHELAAQPAALAGIGVVFGLIRLVSAVGILCNRYWGWALGLLLSLATFSMLTLYIPAGLGDAVFSGIALVGLVIARYGSARLTA